MFLANLTKHCRRQPQKLAIELIDEAGRQRVSYAQLERRVNRTAHYLRSLGVRSGDRVAAQLPKRLPFVYIHLAAARIGAIFLPLNPAYPLAELRYFLTDSAAAVFIADRKDESGIKADLSDLPALRRLIFICPQSNWEDEVAVFPADWDDGLPTDADSIAMLLYTSGTTSRPKAAQITHGNLRANIESLHKAWGWRNDDVLLHVLPIFHVHGLVVALHGALHAGATAVMLAKFEAKEVLGLLRSGRFSVFMAVPTIHRRLHSAAAGRVIDLSHLRLMTSGSDRLPDDLFFGCQKTFKVTLLERYGMTETGMNLSNPLNGERRVGSVGRPLPGVSARVVDPDTGESLGDGEIGEVQIKGAHVCKGYWRQAEKTAAAFTDDGWLRTGDLGLREADGYYTLKGRLKDLIITGGLNVYPPEVERTLIEHTAVAACAVIGCPDDEWGEQVVAVIVPERKETADKDALRDFCCQRLAAYKAPRRIVFVTELPRNALGKIQKAKLRSQLCGGFD